MAKSAITDLAQELGNLSEGGSDDKFTHLPPSYLIPDPEGQDRNGSDWDTEDAQEAVKGIATSASMIVDGKPYGIRIPIEVKATENPRVFHIVAGETRWRAATLAKLELVPVIIKRKASSQALSMDRLIENVVRRNLTIMQLAEALQKRIDEGLSVDDLRALIGNKSRPWLSKYLSPLKMGEDVQKLARDGLLTNVEHMKSLNDLKGKDREKALAKIQKGDDVRTVIEKFCGKKGSKKAGESEGDDNKGSSDKAVRLAFTLTQDEALNILSKLGMKGEFDSPEQIRDAILDAARGGM